MQTELSIFNRIRSLAGQSAILDWAMVFLGEYLGYFLVVVVLIFFLKSQEDWRAKFHNFALVVLSVILSRGILTEVIRFFFRRERPFAVLEIEPLISQAASAALPSGHAAFYFALAFAIWIINKRLGFWLTVGALFIGFGRVVSGVHWPLDILAGALVGLLSVFVVNFLLRSLRGSK